MGGTKSSKWLQPKSQIGSKNTQKRFAMHDRAFSAGNASREKPSRALGSLHLSHESKKPDWNISTYNEALEKDYKRCNTLAEVPPSNFYTSLTKSTSSAVEPTFLCTIIAQKSCRERIP